MILRCCGLILAILAAVHSKPIQNDLAAVNTFIAGLAAQDSRTDSLVTLNYQDMASKKTPEHDNAKNPLFSQVDSSVVGGSTYQAIAGLMKFYQHDSETAQVVSSDFTTAVNTFLDQIVQTKAVSQAWTFLQQQGVSTADSAAFKTQLYNLWFLPYARSQVAGSSGFKSVFFGESTGKVITRFANWYGFYLQELSSSFNYHGWFTKADGVAIDLQFVIGEQLDLETSFLLNTSPEFEFAAYSVAAFTGSQEVTFNVQHEEVTVAVSTLANNGNTVLDKVVVSFGAEHKTTKSSGSHTTKGPKGSDPDLQALVDTMWNADKDRPSSSQVTMNWGTHINGNTGTKGAPLFSKVDESLFSKSQYSDLITTYEKQLFTADVCKAEAPMSGFRKTYLQAVFNTFTSTPMFAAAFNYLKSKDYKETSSLDNFKTKVLWPLWFGTYSRCKGALGSSGWEHVFSGEIKSNEVDGQHDWVRYYLEQKADKMVYDGYYTHDDNLIGTFQYRWNNSLKPKGGFFTGTSPAFDFSILSVCALVHGNGGNCHFKVSNFPITVTSYLQACGDGSGTCLATAYPG